MNDDNIFEKNESMRIEVLDQITAQSGASLAAFFRHIGAPHVYAEDIVPSFEHDQSRVVAAVWDRPWPPWGAGARRVHATCYASGFGLERGSVSMVFVSDDDALNVGLMGAVYKEMLHQIQKAGTREIVHAVRHGSVLIHRLLSARGFCKTDEPYLTEEARYFIYSADPKEVLDHLGLANVSTEELLRHQISEDTLEGLALWFSVMQLSARSRILEILLHRGFLG